MNYQKLVEVTSTGMVVATVKNSLGETKGLGFFSPLFYTNKQVEKCCKKAHVWADERIKVCQRQEVSGER